MVEKNRSIFGDVEKKLGLPSLSSVASALEKLPDAKQLQMVKEVLIAAEAVTRSAPELDKVAVLIREINSMPIEKLKQLDKLLSRIERIIKTAPQDLLNFLTNLK
jgi:hypothetical protein